MSVKRYFQGLPFKIIFPAVLTVVLFVATIFVVIIPRLETNMMLLKREKIKELTEIARSSLETFEAKEQKGLLSPEQSRVEAINHLRQLRFGPDLKDYFWINDMHPRIIMHPYRSDLEGKDVSQLTDPNGKPIFMEFVKVVQDAGAGYVDYEWQWQDDPSRIVPKISYVTDFKPWGWIVGTGIYIEDVRQEIMSITQKLVGICFAITGFAVLLAAYIIWQGMRAEQKRRQAEEQAKNQQEQLFQASKMASLGTLVSGVAHEINNPIMSIMLNAPVLKDAWQHAVPILDEHYNAHGEFYINKMPFTMLRDRLPLLLADVLESAKRVENIVSDLKDFARETPPDQLEKVYVNAVMEKAVGLVENLIKKSTTNFTVSQDQGLPAIKGNAQRIEQVIINLLVNACQALTDKKQVISVASKYDQSISCAIIEVKDQGVGMPAEVLERIRDPFFTTKRDSGGTGLGLAISERIIKDHGGSMHYFSEPGIGTTAQIHLPVVIDNGAKTQ